MSEITVHIYNNYELHNVRTTYANDINNITKIIVHSSVNDVIHNFQDVNGIGVFENIPNLKMVYLPREISLIGENIFRYSNSIHSVILDLFEYEFQYIYDYQTQLNNLTNYHTTNGLSLDIYYTKHRLNTNDELNQFIAYNDTIKSYVYNIEIPKNTDITTLPANFLTNTNVSVFTIPSSIIEVHETAFVKGLDTTVINMTEQEWNSLIGSEYIVQYSRNVVFSFYTIDDPIDITRTLSFDTTEALKPIAHVHLDNQSDVELLLALPQQIQYINLITYNANNISYGINLINILNYDASGSVYHVKTKNQVENIRSKVPLVETIYVYSNTDIVDLNDLNGIGVFQDITCLKTIYLPNTLQSIGNNIFMGCFDLSNVVIDIFPFQSQYINNIDVIQTSYTQASVYFSKYMINNQNDIDIFMSSTQKIKNYIRYIDIVPDSNVNTIPNEFLQGTIVKEITIPNTITNIGANAFLSNMLIVLAMTDEQWNNVDGSLNVTNTKNMTFSYFEFLYSYEYNTNEYTFEGDFTFEKYEIVDYHSLYIKHQYELQMFAYSIQQPKYMYLIQNIYIQPDEDTVLHLFNNVFQYTNITNLYVPHNVTMLPYTFNNLPLLSYIFFDMYDTNSEYEKLDSNTMQNITSYFTKHKFNSNDELIQYKQDYVINNNYNYLVNEIVFSEGNTITEIPSNIFENCNISSLNLELSQQLEKIGDYAFKNTGIQDELKLSNSIHYYGEGCFLDCSNIDVVFLNSVLDDTSKQIQIKEKAFYLNNVNGFDCIINNDIMVNETNLNIFGNDETNLTNNISLSFAQQYDIFFRKHYFTSQLQLDQHVQHYNIDHSFNIYISHIEFELTSDISYIPDNAFRDSNITNIIMLPQSLLSIGESAFYNIQHDMSIVLSANNNLKIHKNAFRIDGNDEHMNISFLINELVNFDFWKNMFSVYDDDNENKQNYTNCFTGRTISLNYNITFHNEHDFLGDMSLNYFLETDYFYSNTEILFMSIVFSDDYIIKVLPSEKFKELNINNLYIPYTVVIIDNNCFENASLKTIHFDQTNHSSQLYNINNYVFARVNKKDNDQQLQLELPGNVFKIGEYAFFESNINITFNEEEDNIQSIGKYAFSKSTINRFTLPSNVDIINEYTFQDCSGLNSIVFSPVSTLHTIDRNAFEGTNLNEQIVLPENLKTIETDAFKNALYADITINSINTINNNALLLETNNNENYRVQFGFSYYEFTKVLERSNVLNQSDIFSSMYQLNFEGLYFVDQNEINNHLHYLDENTLNKIEINAITTTIDLNLESDISDLPPLVFENIIPSLMLLPSTLITVDFDAFRNAFLLETIVINDLSYTQINYEESILHFNNKLQDELSQDQQLIIQNELFDFSLNKVIVLDKHNTIFHYYDIDVNNLLIGIIFKDYTNDDVYTLDISNTFTINKEYTDYELLFMKTNEARTRYVCGYGKEITTETETDMGTETETETYYQTDILIYEITKSELNELEMILNYKTTLTVNSKIEELVVSNTHDYLETDFIFYYDNFAFTKYNYNDISSTPITWDISFNSDTNDNYFNQIIEIKDTSQKQLFKIYNLSINSANNYIVYNYFYINKTSSANIELFKTNNIGIINRPKYKKETYKQYHYTAIHHLYEDDLQLRKIFQDCSGNISNNNLNNNNLQPNVPYTINEIADNIERKSYLCVDRNMNYLISYLHVNSKDENNNIDLSFNKTTIYYLADVIHEISIGRSPSSVFNDENNSFILSEKIEHSLEFTENSNIMHGIFMYPEHLNSHRLYFLLSLYNGTRLFSVFKTLDNTDTPILKITYITTFEPVNIPSVSITNNTILTENNYDNPIVVIDNSSNTLIVGNVYQVRYDLIDDEIHHDIVADLYNINRRTIVYGYSIINNNDEYNEIKHILDLDDKYVKTLEFTNKITMIYSNQFNNIYCDDIILPTTLISIGSNVFTNANITNVIIDMYEDEFNRIWNIHNSQHYTYNNNIRFIFKRIKWSYDNILNFPSDHVDISYIQYIDIGTININQFHQLDNVVSNSYLSDVHTIYINNYPFTTQSSHNITNYKIIYTRQIFNTLDDVEPFYKSKFDYKYVREIMFNGITKIDYDEIFYNTHVEIAITTQNQSILSGSFNKNCVNFLPFVTQLKSEDSGVLEFGNTNVSLDIISGQIFNGYFQDISNNFDVNYIQKTIYLLNDIDLSGSIGNENINNVNNFIRLPTSWTLDGNDYSIDVGNNVWNGFIISNIELNDDVVSINNYCNVKNLNVLNTILNLNSGGIIFPGNKYINIDNCYVKIQDNTNEKWGGIIGSTCSYINIYNSHTDGNINLYSGGIVAYDCNNINCTLCYSTGDIGNFAGGIIAPYCVDCNLNLCYSSGDISESAGGIIAGDFYEEINDVEFNLDNDTNTKETLLTYYLHENDTDIFDFKNRGLNHLTECYATGNIIGQRAGGICGSLSGYYSKIKLNKCYFNGVFNENISLCGGLIGAYSGYKGSIEINDSYVHSNIFGIGSGGLIGGFCGVHEIYEKRIDDDDELSAKYIKSYRDQNTDYNIKLNGCYFYGTVTAIDCGGIVGKNCVSVKVNNCYTHTYPYNELQLQYYDKITQYSAAGIIGTYLDNDHTKLLFNIELINTYYTENNFNYDPQKSIFKPYIRFIGGDFSKRIKISQCFTDYSFFYEDVSGNAIEEAFLSYTLKTININLISISSKFRENYIIVNKSNDDNVYNYNIYLRYFNNSTNTLTNPWSKDSYNTNKPRFMFNNLLSTDIFNVDFDNKTVVLKENITSNNIGSILTSSSHLFLGDGWTFDGDYNYIDLFKLDNWNGLIECNNYNGKETNIIKNVGIVNGSNVTSGNGYLLKSPSAFIHIENCYVDKCIIKTSSTGGFIGYTKGDTFIQNSYFSGEIVNNEDDENDSNLNKAGIIFRQEDFSLKIYSCFCNCDINTTSSFEIAGFVVFVSNSHIDISNSYFNGYIHPLSSAVPILWYPMEMTSVSKTFYNVYATGYDSNYVNGIFSFFPDYSSADLSNVYAVDGKIINNISNPDFDISDFSGGTIWNTNGDTGLIADTYTNSYPIISSFKKFPWMNYNHNKNPTYHQIYFFGDFNTFIDSSFFIDYDNKITYITQDITISDINSHIILNDGWVFDGNNHVITFNTLGWRGMIKTRVEDPQYKVRIFNTNIKFDYDSLENNTNKYIRQQLNVINSSTYNCGYILQKQQKNAIITKCTVYADIHSGGGGIVGGLCSDFSVKDCFVIGNIHDNAGGIVGSYCDNFQIENCYTQGEIFMNSGGILGSNCGNSINNKILSCYTIGNILGENAGGIVGANSNTLLIEDVYTTGQINGRNASGIIGNIDHDNYIVRLYNCICYGAIQYTNSLTSNSNYIFPDGLFIENRNCFDNNLTYSIYEPSMNDISVNNVVVGDLKYSVFNYDVYNFIELSANWSEYNKLPTYKMRYKIDIVNPNPNDKISIFVKVLNNYVNIETYDNMIDTSGIYIHVEDTNLENEQYIFNYYPIISNEFPTRLITLGNFEEPGTNINKDDITRQVQTTFIEYNINYTLDYLDKTIVLNNTIETSIHNWVIELSNNEYASKDNLYFKLIGYHTNSLFVPTEDTIIDIFSSNKYSINDISYSFGTTNQSDDYTFILNKNIGFDYNVNQTNYIRFNIGVPLKFLSNNTYFELKLNKNETFNSSFNDNDVISLNLDKIEYYTPDKDDISVYGYVQRDTILSFDYYETYNLIELSGNWTDLNKDDSFKLQYHIFYIENGNIYTKNEQNEYIDICNNGNIVDISRVYFKSTTDHLINDQYYIQYSVLISGNTGLGSPLDTFSVSSQDYGTIDLYMKEFDDNSIDHELEFLEQYIHTDNDKYVWKIKVSNSNYPLLHTYIRISQIFNGYSSLDHKNDVFIEFIESSNFSINELNYITNNMNVRFNKSVGFGDYIIFNVIVPLSKLSKDASYHIICHNSINTSTIFYNYVLVDLGKPFINTTDYKVIDSRRIIYNQDTIQNNKNITDNVLQNITYSNLECNFNDDITFNDISINLIGKNIDRNDIFINKSLQLYLTDDTDDKNMIYIPDDYIFDAYLNDGYLNKGITLQVYKNPCYIDISFTDQTFKQDVSFVTVIDNRIYYMYTNTMKLIVDRNNIIDDFLDYSLEYKEINIIRLSNRTMKSPDAQTLFYDPTHVYHMKKYKEPDYNINLFSLYSITDNGLNTNNGIHAQYYNTINNGYYHTLENSGNLVGIDIGAHIGKYILDISNIHYKDAISIHNIDSSFSTYIDETYDMNNKLLVEVDFSNNEFIFNYKGEDISLNTNDPSMNKYQFFFMIGRTYTFKAMSTFEQQLVFYNNGDVSGSLLSENETLDIKFNNEYDISNINHYCISTINSSDLSYPFMTYHKTIVYNSLQKPTYHYYYDTQLTIDISGNFNKEIGQVVNVPSIQSYWYGFRGTYRRFAYVEDPADPYVQPNTSSGPDFTIEGEIDYKPWAPTELYFIQSSSNYTRNPDDANTVLDTTGTFELLYNNSIIMTGDYNLIGKDITVFSDYYTVSISNTIELNSSELSNFNQVRTMKFYVG